MVTVTTEAVSNDPGAPSQRLSARFDDDDSFLLELASGVVDIGRSVYQVMESNVRIQGSDPMIEFRDPQPGGNSFIAYRDLYHHLAAHPQENTTGMAGVFMVLPFTDPRPAIFRSGRGRVPLAVRRRREANDREERDFLNDVGKIAEAKKWIAKPENESVIEDCMDESWSHVKFHGETFETARQVIKFYLELSCILFSIELYFGRSPFLKLLQGELGITCPGDPSALREELRGYHVPAKVHNSMCLKQYPNKLCGWVLADLDVNIPLNAPRRPGHPITDAEIAQISLFLHMDFMFFQLDGYIKLSKTCNRLMPNSSLLSREDNDLLNSAFKARHNRPLVMYQFVSPGTNGRVQTRMNKCLKSMIFVVTDLFSPHMHAEGVFDAEHTQTFFNEASGSLSAETVYRQGVLMGAPRLTAAEKELLEFQEMTGENNHDLVAHPSYMISKPIITCLSLLNKVPTSITIKSAVDLCDFLKKYKKTIATYFDELRVHGGDEEVCNSAFTTLWEDVPRMVYMHTEFFRDQDMIGLFPILPFSDDGVINIVDLLGLMVTLTTSDNEDICEYCIPKGVEFVSAYMVNDSTVLRKMLTRRELAGGAEGEPVVAFTMKNIKSFTLRVNASGADAQGLGNVTVLTTFSCKNREGEAIARVIVEDKNKNLPQTPIIDEMIENAVTARLADQEQNGIDHTKVIAHIRSKEGVRHALSKQNAFMSTFFILRGTGRAKKVDGGRLLLNFEENWAVQMETHAAYFPQIFEVPVPVMVDPGAYDGTVDTWKEVDLSKLYTSIMQGGYSKAWEQDMWGDFVQVGGMRNPSIQVVDTPLTSYFVDYGKVYIEGGKIDWVELQNISKDYFNATSSWVVQRQRGCFVSTYVIIHVCQKVCRLLNLKGRTDRLAMHARIQKAMGIKAGLFDFTYDQREAFTRRRTHKAISTNDWAEKIKAEFGSIIETVLRSRYIISHSKVSTMLPEGELHHGLPVRSFAGREYIGRDGKVYNERTHGVFAIHHSRVNVLFARFSSAAELLLTACDSIEEGFAKLKVEGNTCVGSLKNASAGGVKHTQISSLSAEATQAVADPYKKRKTDAGEPTTKKIHDIDGCVYRANMSYWTSDLPSTDTTLVINSSLKIESTRNSLAPLREYIMNTARIVMDHISCLSKPVRVATDSALIQPKYLRPVKEYISSMTWGADDTTPRTHFMPGHMESFTVKDVNLKLPHQHSVNLEFGKDGEVRTRLGAPDGILESKYRSIFNDSYEKYNKLKIFHLTDIERAEIDKVNTEYEEYTTSSIFMYYYKKGGSSFPEFDLGAKDGIALHEALSPFLGTNQLVTTFYKQFTNYLARKIMDGGGALMVGDPGCGKSEMCKTMCDIAEEQRKKSVVVAGLHAVVQLYKDCVADNMTIHSFCGCKVDAAKHARNPYGVLRKHHGRGHCLPAKYDILFCDEFETCDKEFEEYFKVCKETYRMNIFLVGDPLQSAPMFGRGIEASGSVAHFVTNGKKYVFDMQFRNIDKGYATRLQETAAGQISKYLAPEMSAYHDLDEAHDEMDTLLSECAQSIIDRTPVRIFAVPNYNLNRCIVTEVLRRCVIKNPKFILQSMEVLVHIGASAYNPELDDDQLPEETFTQKRKCTMTYARRVSNEPQIATETNRWGEQWGRDRNGAGGMASLVGVPLIMRKGMEFRVLHRFTSQVSHDVFEKTNVFKYVRTMAKTATYEKTTKIGREKAKTTTENIKLKVYVFEDSTGEHSTMSRYEVCRNMMYAFAIQREFILGATLDSLAIVQMYMVPSEHQRSVHHMYRRIKDTLAEQERVYEDLSVMTTLARFMRVAVTRVRRRDATAVLDLQVDDKWYWKHCLWNHTPFMVSQWQNTNWRDWTACTEKWREGVLMGTQKLTITGKCESRTVPKDGLEFNRRHLSAPMTTIHEAEQGGDGEVVVNEYKVLDPAYGLYAVFPLYLM